MTIPPPPEVAPIVPPASRRPGLWLAIVETALIALGLLALSVIAYAMFGHGNCTLDVRARSQADHLAMQIADYRQVTGRDPVTLDELAAPSNADGLGPWSKASELIDPWRRAFHYRASTEADGFVLFTLGADGRIGGSGLDADYQARDPAVAD